MDILKSLRQIAETEKMAGVTELYGGTSKTVSGGQRTKTFSLASLEKTVSECALCELAGTRTNTVFGEGSGSADLMFIGEAPGRDEDEQGRGDQQRRRGLDRIWIYHKMGGLSFSSGSA